ncbi:TPA: hypothetical protein SI646_004430, partial [Escherichia coli]|nr:hypothetical protein [Escherichia coli]
MKKTSDRIFRRSALSVLVTAALYTSHVMAFTERVTDGSTVTGETVENGVQIVESGGTADNTTIEMGGMQGVY